MNLSTPVLLIHCRVLLVYAFPDVESSKITFTTGIRSICDTSLIIGFVGGGNIETYLMVRQLNNVWSKILLLVWVTVSGFLSILPCESLAVTVFNSYPASFNVKLFIEWTRSSDLSIFSLVNIASKFSLCELDAWMNASEVTLSASVIDYSSSSIMTFNINSRIFTLDNGVLLFSLKGVMVLLSYV